MNILKLNESKEEFIMDNNEILQLNVKKKNGQFITVEGIDGTGKSTHTKFIVDEIKKRYDKEVISTREPGGTKAAEKIREFILADHGENFPVEAEILLFNAARIFHIENLIKPSINEGKVVVCDRFSDSTFAYQCAHGAEFDSINQIHQWTLKGFHPDYTFFFFASKEEIKKRIGERKIKDRFDNEIDINDINEKKNNMFLKLMNTSKAKCFFIDSSGNKTETEKQIIECLNHIFLSQ